METALEKLKEMAAWDSTPELTEGELESILEEASLADNVGFEPVDIGWTPTYDLNAAAAAAWLIKAARASPLTEVDPPGSGIVTSKVFDNCRTMASLYSRKRTASARMSTTYTQ